MTAGDPSPDRRQQRGAIGADFTDVLAAARAGDPAALTRLYRSLARTVAGYLRAQGAADPDGTANDVFLRAFGNLHRFQGDERRFRSWVVTIAHHRLVDERRRAARRPVTSPLAGESGATGDVEDEALAAMGTERMHELLGRLAPDQRDVLVLRVVADLGVDQVAKALGKTPGAVKQLQRRGLASLARLLASEEVPTRP